ncbi:MAG: alkaline phosphatase family protein [Bacteroidaceae bacterium]|nr:alkaline phosphatase family protein [Bacteroidaceae bacterium]
MKGRILTSLLAVMTLAGLQAQEVPAVPKLVVGLTIDQLRMDYVEAFSAMYGDRGFKRLWKEARIYRNAEYDFANVDRSSAIAAVTTGTHPHLNGIIANAWLDRSSLQVINCVDDTQYMGVYTTESTSPARLKVSNLSDELMIATQGTAEVYSIAPTREMAVLSAGHASKGAFWINDETGKWSGSTYYDNFPKWVSTYNDRQGLDFRIGELVWGPYLPVTSYKYLTSDTKQVTFKHKFDDERRNKYRKFKTSPYANEEVNRLVNACLNGTSIGKDYVPDLLNLSYFAGNYDHKPVTECPMEMQDVYVRLDASLADLLDIIDRKVGLSNTLFCITSTGYFDADPIDSHTYRIPTGEFHIKRCTALLNLYLAAIYGEGQYVEAYHEQEIYLNHKLIEQKQLNLPEILARSSEFLVQFSGVKDVYSSQRLMLGAWTPELDKVKNHYHASASGDLWIEVLPGWTIVRDHSMDSKVVRHVYTSAPLMFMGWDVKPAIIHTPVKIGHIAPTLTHFMRIRAPNAAALPPLADIRK